MGFKSLLGSVVRYMSGGLLRSKPRGASQPRRSRLFLEVLEAREVLAVVAPTVIAVSPMNGASNVDTTNGLTLTVTYSETMTASATDTGNYALLDSAGNKLSLTGATFSSTNTANDTVNLTVGGTPLPVDSYTLFVRGDQVKDQNDGLALANPPQLIAANGGRNNVSVMTVNSDGTLGTTGTYIQDPNGTTAANPNAIAFGDFDGDGVADLAVVNAGTNTINIYQGKDPNQGGGYSIAPDLQLTLPSVSTTNLAKSIVIGNFNSTADNALDIAVLNQDSGKLSVFLNARTSVGTLAFADSVDTTTSLSTPKDLVATDIDGDGYTDLVALNSGLTGTNYTVSIFSGDGTGSFSAQTALVVGTNNGTTTTGIQAPVALAVGYFAGNDRTLDIAVAGTNGVGILVGTQSPGFYTFNSPTSLIYTGTGLTGLKTLQGPVAVSGTITDATVPATPSGRLRITTASTTGLAVGNTVRLTGITGFTGAGTSGLFTITAVTGTTFDVAIAGLSGSYTGGGSWGRVDNPNDDLVATTSTSVISLLNNGQATWISSARTVAGASGGIVVGDLDRDGRNEVVVTSPTNPGSLTILDTNTSYRAVENATIPATDTLRITSTGHGLSVGSTVTLSGLAGFTAGYADGEYTVTARTANTFDVAMTGITGTYTGGGTWARSSSSATYSNTAGVLTVTSVGHGLTSGTLVTLTGTAGGDGTYSANVIDADHFILVNTVTATSYAGAKYVVAAPLAVDYQQGTPTSTAGQYVTGAGSTGVALGDSDNDGKLDVAVANGTDNTFSLLLGSGDRKLEANTTTAVTPTKLNGVAYADVNQDGIKDILTVNSTGSAAASMVTIQLGKLDGTYANPQNYPIGTTGGSITNITSIAAVDLNGDGKLDVVVAGTGSGGSGAVAVLRNTTSTAGNTATFATAAFFQTGSAPTSIAAADLNGDGKTDLAVTHNAGGRFGSRGLSLMKNTSTATAISFIQLHQRHLHLQRGSRRLGQDGGLGGLGVERGGPGLQQGRQDRPGRGGERHRQATSTSSRTTGPGTSPSTARWRPTPRTWWRSRPATFNNDGFTDVGGGGQLVAGADGRGVGADQPGGRRLRRGGRGPT